MAVIEAIATTYLEADAATVTFSGIPATYEHLQIHASARSNKTSSFLDTIYVQFNGDTASNYSQHNMNANGTSLYTGMDAGASTVNPGYAAVDGAQSAAEYSVFVIDILDYANTNKNTSVQGVNVLGLTYTSVYLRPFSASWRNTAAVTSILFDLSSGSWKRGSEFTLYGLNSA